MALADPQSIKISGTTTSLPRVSTGDYKSKYESADGTIDLSLSTATTGSGRRRQTARLDITKITADPFLPAQNIELGSSVYLVVDRPIAGFTNAEALAIFSGFIERLTATENKIVTQLLAGES